MCIVVAQPKTPSRGPNVDDAKKLEQGGEGTASAESSGVDGDGRMRRDLRP